MSTVDHRRIVVGATTLASVALGVLLVFVLLRPDAEEDRKPATAADGTSSRAGESSYEIGTAGRSQAHASNGVDGGASQPVAVDEAGDSRDDRARSELGSDVVAGIEQVSRTFLTDDPDLLGLDRVLADLAGQAAVVAESVSVDELTGRISGKLHVGDGLPEGTFEIDGDSYRVEWTTDAGGAKENGMLLRTLGVHFEADSAGIGAAGSGIQYHPDTRTNSSAILPLGEERYAGWAVRQAADGDVRVVPIAVRSAANGVAWEIGKPNRLQPHPAPWAAGNAAIQLLYGKLSTIGN